MRRQRWKSVAAILLSLALVFALSACGSETKQEPATDAASNKTPTQQTSPVSQTPETQTPKASWPQSETEQTGTEPSAEPSEPTETQGPKILVAVFSATGNTASLAETVAELLGADLYVITPVQPYTEADLAYYTGGRCDQEQADPDCRPTIDGRVEDMARYDTVVIAHPIWHGQAPRIISTFLESYDFSGKTLTTFCTSMSSPLGSSAENLHGLVPEDVTWLESRRFPAGASREELAGWLTEIGLLKPEQTEGMTMQMLINDTPVNVQWEENESVAALTELVREGPLTVSMSPYGGFEQVGPIGRSLPRSDVQTVTQAGDLVLYSGNQLVVFYGSNTWAYTRLGRITDKTPAELASLLSDGAVTVTLSMPNENGSTKP